jgi:hypothetical protein
MTNKDSCSRKTAKNISQNNGQHVKIAWNIILVMSCANSTYFPKKVLKKIALWLLSIRLRSGALQRVSSNWPNNSRPNPAICALAARSKFRIIRRLSEIKVRTPSE